MAHSSHIKYIATSNYKIATVSSEEPIKIWEISSLLLISECYGGDSNPIEITEDKVYSWSNTNTILEWEISKSKYPIRHIHVPFHITCIYHYENLLYIGTSEGLVHMFDINFVFYDSYPRNFLFVLLVIFLQKL